MEGVAHRVQGEAGQRDGGEESRPYRDTCQRCYRKNTNAFSLHGAPSVD